MGATSYKLHEIYMPFLAHICYRKFATRSYNIITPPNVVCARVSHDMIAK